MLISWPKLEIVHKTKANALTSFALMDVVGPSDSPVGSFVLS